MSARDDRGVTRRGGIVVAVAGVVGAAVSVAMLASAAPPDLPDRVLVRREDVERMHVGQRVEAVIPTDEGPVPADLQVMQLDGELPPGDAPVEVELDDGEPVLQRWTCLVSSLSTVLVGLFLTRRSRSDGRATRA